MGTLGTIHGVHLHAPPGSDGLLAIPRIFTIKFEHVIRVSTTTTVYASYEHSLSCSCNKPRQPAQLPRNPGCRPKIHDMALFLLQKKCFNGTATMNSSLIGRFLTIPNITFTEEYKLV